jgi:ribonuclease I
MKARIVVLCLSLLTGLPAAYAGAPVPKTPGAFDAYVLALTYHNEFCREKPQEAECNQGPVLKGMVLHGLWPNRNDDPKNSYGYCDLPPEQVNHDWCSAAIDVKNQMPAKEFAELAESVPGTTDCLYNHEWYAHGACSGLSVSEYFADALAITKSFQALPHIQRLIQASAGKSVDRADLTNALMQDLGNDADGKFVVLCRKDPHSGTEYFSQLSIGLDKDRLMDFPAADSLAPLKPYTDKNGQQKRDQGNCPAHGIVVVP